MYRNILRSDCICVTGYGRWAALYTENRKFGLTVYPIRVQTQTHTMMQDENSFSK